MTEKRNLNLDGMTVQEVLRVMSEHHISSIDGEQIERNEQARAWEEATRETVERERSERSEEVQQLRRKVLERWTGPNALEESECPVSALYHCQPSEDGSREGPLDIDHTRTWQQDGKLLCVTTEPYRLEREKLQDIANLCAEHGLAAYIHYGAEVHYPGKCFAIVTVKAGNEANIPTLSKAIAAHRTIPGVRSSAASV